MATERGRGSQGGAGAAQSGDVNASLLQGISGIAGQLQEVVTQLQGIVEQLVGSQGAGANGQSSAQEGGGEQDGGNR